MPKFNVCINEEVDLYFPGIEAPDECEAKRLVMHEYLNGKRTPDETQVSDRWATTYTED